MNKATSCNARRLPVLLAALVVLLSAIGAGGSFGSGMARAAVTAPADGYGFAGGSDMLWLSQADLDRELDGVEATSATWLRVVVDWNSIEATKGTYNWTTPDRLINSARTHGLKVIATVVSSPSWSRALGSILTAPPTDNSDLTTFLKAFVKRYNSKVSAYQIWNEVNLPLFFGGLPDAARYTAMLKASYSAIKSVAPKATVLAAGLARSVGIYSPVTYFQSMYAHGVKGYFDAAAMHPYTFPGGLAADPENAITDTVSVHNLMVGMGDGDKKIWFTEFGAPTASGSTDGVTEQQQATQITQVLWFAANCGFAGPALIYSIRDTGVSTTDREQRFGALFNYDWTPKYAATVLAG